MERIMAFKIQVGPPQISIHQDQTILISELDGQIKWPSEKGLFFRDTRVISSWAIFANGEPWDLLDGGAITYYATRIVLTNRAFLTEDGTIPARTLGLTIGRWIGGGVHEDIEVTNKSMKTVRFQLEIAIRSDFADLFEVKSNSIVRRGRITTEWSQTGQLRTSYRNRDFVRAVAISTAQSSSKAAYANGRLSFEIELGPAERWHTCLLYTLEDGAARLSPPHDHVRDCEKSPHAEVLAEWLQEVVKIRTSNEEFYRLFRRALEDMAALRLPIEAADRHAFMPAAGLPWFVAPFGRDSLIVSLQNVLIYPHFARGALDFLGSLQAKEDDSYRDAEPGKIFMNCGVVSSRISNWFRILRITVLLMPRRYISSRYTQPGVRPATWRYWSGILKSLRAACLGSTIPEIATVMAFRNTRRVRQSVTRTCLGRIQVTASSIRTARW
jgi:glycogen debranching enzyme